MSGSDPNDARTSNVPGGARLGALTARFARRQSEAPAASGSLRSPGTPFERLVALTAERVDGGDVAGDGTAFAFRPDGT